MVSQMAAYAIGGGCGVVAGAFCPAIGRKIKSLFVKKTQAAKAAVGGAVASAASSVASEAKKI